MKIKDIFYEPPIHAGQPSRWLRFGWKLLIVLTICGSIIAGLVGGSVAYESHQCEVQGDKLELAAEWTFWTDCRVFVVSEEKGRWVPVDSYRVVIEDGAND